MQSFLKKSEQKLFKAKLSCQVQMNKNNGETNLFILRNILFLRILKTILLLYLKVKY